MTDIPPRSDSSSAAASIQSARVFGSPKEATPVVIDGRHAIDRRDGLVYEGLTR